jgi:putative transposase
MESQELESHAHCVYRIFFHVVFVTKYRRKAITPEMLVRLREHFARLCVNAGCELVECNGEADHVHLLIGAHPDLKPSRLVNTLKTISSREIRKEFADHLKGIYWKPVFWHRAYCILSAGGSPLEVIKRYIESQGREKSDFHPRPAKARVGNSRR